MSMTDPVITEQGEPVGIELLYMRHRVSELADVDSVEAALSLAQSIEDYGDGSTVAVLVGGDLRLVRGRDFGWHPPGVFPACDQRAADSYREAKQREHDEMSVSALS